MRKRIKNIVINYLTRHLLKAVTEEDVLQELHLTREERRILKEEAYALKESMLWKYIKKELQWKANQRRGEQCLVPDDVLFGAAMYHNFDIIEKFLKRLRDL